MAPRTKRSGNTARTAQQKRNDTTSSEDPTPTAHDDIRLLIKENDALKEEINALKDENDELTQEIETLRRDNT